MVCEPRPVSDETLLARPYADPTGNGALNPPVYHLNTVGYPSYEAYRERQRNVLDFSISDPFSGNLGSPTSQELERVMAALDGAYRSIAVSTGLAAIVTVLMNFAKAGAHFLVTDGVYGITRSFCLDRLAPLGVEVEFFDPAIGDGIASRIRTTTALVYLEAPSSLVWEIPDIAPIAAAARARGVPTAIDNSWAGPLHCKPLSHGVDISITSASKNVGGHSDLYLGVVSTTEVFFTTLKNTAAFLGHIAPPEACYLALRGIRTMAVRMERYHRSALEVAGWMQARPEVASVLYPPLPGDREHGLWCRYFTGAGGIFSTVMAEEVTEARCARFLNALRLFTIGFGGGGFATLALPIDPQRARTVRPWVSDAQVIRFNIGLEDPTDLIADLEQAFRAAAES